MRVLHTRRSVLLNVPLRRHRSCAFPTGKSIVTASDDNYLISWDPRSGSATHKVLLSNSPFRFSSPSASPSEPASSSGAASLALNAAGTVAVVGSTSVGGVVVVNLVNGSIVAGLEGHDASDETSVEAIVIYEPQPAGGLGLIATAGTDGAICVFDAGSYRLRTVLKQEVRRVTSLAFPIKLTVGLTYARTPSLRWPFTDRPALPRLLFPSSRPRRPTPRYAPGTSGPASSCRSTPVIGRSYTTSRTPPSAEARDGSSVEAKTERRGCGRSNREHDVPHVAIASLESRASHGGAESESGLFCICDLLTCWREESSLLVRHLASSWMRDLSARKEGTGGRGTHKSYLIKLSTSDVAMLAICLASIQTHS